jgi:hypothetical protein
MFKRKVFFSFGIIFALSLLTIQPVVAAELTWHSSVITGASWKWRVKDLSGEVSIDLGYFFSDLENEFDIEVFVVGNPPTEGNWVTLFSSTSDIDWVEFYINGTQVTGSGEAAIYLFIAPLNIGNDTNGWETWINMIYYATSLFLGSVEKNQHTDGNLTTYLCSTSGSIGNLQLSVSQEIVYDHTSGILNKYKVEQGNGTHTSSFTISLTSGEDTSEELSIPGFDLGVTILSLSILIVLPIIFQRFKK